MKTFSEYQAAEQELAAERGRRNQDRLAALNAMIDELEKRAEQIEVFVEHGSTAKRAEQFRDLVRRAVRAGDVAALEIACDHCGVELFDTEPHARLMSNPPKKRIACPGCGWTSFIRA